ncbi:MAG: Fic family protein [Acidobacteria bacterium]|nr:Fic family protein [Acidobacteriota bacterium]
MYRPITPVPDDAGSLSSSELAALAKVWIERRDELQSGNEYQEFLKKLQREWAIETGIIERLYTWDRGVTEILIEQGIDASLIASRGGIQREQADHIKNLIDDQLSIIEGLFAFIKGEQPMTEHFIRSMHQQFTSHQLHTEALTPDGQRIQVELLRGEYKKLPNNPRRPDGLMHEYCPPELVKEEMEMLVKWHQEYEGRIAPETLSAWLHHRFTQIHPFQDGNGRVARALASLVFLKAGLFPLVIRDADRKEYIERLEKADAGDLAPLVKLFAQRQRDSVLKALGIEQQVQQSRYAEDIIASTIKVLEERTAVRTEQLGQVYATADQLRQIAYQRLREIAEKISAGFAQADLLSKKKYSARADFADNQSPNKNYFQQQIIEVAKLFGYFANLDRYRSWIRLTIWTEESFEFLISLHGYGFGMNGIMVASAFTARRVPREEGGTDTVNTQPASPDLFQFNYAEPAASTEKRFRDWLEGSLAIALAEWRRLASG